MSCAGRPDGLMDRYRIVPARKAYQVVATRRMFDEDRTDAGATEQGSEATRRRGWNLSRLIGAVRCCWSRMMNGSCSTTTCRSRRWQNSLHRRAKLRPSRSPHDGTLAPQVVSSRIHERQTAASTASMPNARPRRRGQAPKPHRGAPKAQGLTAAIAVAGPSPVPSTAPDDPVSLNSTGAAVPMRAFATTRIYTSLTLDGHDPRPRAHEPVSFLFIRRQQCGIIALTTTKSRLTPCRRHPPQRSGRSSQSIAGAWRAAREIRRAKRICGRLPSDMRRWRSVPQLRYRELRTNDYPSSRASGGLARFAEPGLA